MQIKRGYHMKQDISYIIAKLETIHTDVSLLKLQVDALRQQESAKKAVSKFVIGALAILGATTGWLIDNAIAVAQHIVIRS